ncbi:pro-resilin-like [Macrobrachium rosenbergii]|uniref:pro-resilin-like n=1 Tax=Macrobrachium rosenbergii TaxID=79674 RepID=UPI0034D7408E
MPFFESYGAPPVVSDSYEYSSTAFFGLVACQRLPSSSYGAPNGGFTNGFGGSNGAPSNGYSAPNGNGFGGSNGAPSNGYSAPNGNGASNGSGGRRNGFGGSNGAPRNGYAAPPSNSYGAPTNGYGVDAEIAALAENIPGGGVPGEDYPILASVPDTGFDCNAQNVPGYYADTDAEAGCQVFHICQDRPNGRRQQDSFLCPNGTIFNQQYLVCDWWFNFDCADAEDFYSVNELIGVDPNAGYGYGNGNGNSNQNGNGNGRNGYSNGNGSNGNGRNGSNGNGRNGYSNGNGTNGNRNGRNGYGNGNAANGNGRNGHSNGNGSRGNGNGGNGYSNGNNGNGANGVSSSYGAPF